MACVLRNTGAGKYAWQGRADCAGTGVKREIETAPRFKIGDRVRVTEGGWRGRTGKIARDGMGGYYQVAFDDEASVDEGPTFHVKGYALDLAPNPTEIKVREVEPAKALSPVDLDAVAIKTLTAERDQLRVELTEARAMLARVSQERAGIAPVLRCEIQDGDE